MAQILDEEYESKVAGKEEVLSVLREYLQLFNSGQFKYYIAHNTIVDLFGRSVRGPAKITDYLRIQIGAQYKHKNFDKVEQCGPIESKPSHWETRKIPTRGIDFIPARNKVISMSSLKNYADSEVEEDNLYMFSPPSNRTRADAGHGFTIEDLTPSPSSNKLSDSFISESDNEEQVDNKAKRLKRAHPTPFTYLRRLPSKLPNQEGTRPLFDYTSSEDEEEHNEINSNKNYTSLRYLTATGILQSKAKNNESGSTYMVSAGSWDRSVRLKISYRRCIVDRQIQFALIIYENLEQTVKLNETRRNLMNEFNFTNISDASLLEGETTGNSGDNVALNGDNNETISVVEQPAFVLNAAEETVVATVETPSTEEIAAALEAAAFTIAPLRTPTKSLHTTTDAPKRKSRSTHSASVIKRLNFSPSSTTPKRSAARSLRL